MNAVQPAIRTTPAVAAHRSLNIALLGYRSHPHVGGQGIYLAYLAAALHDLGHRVDVISGPPYPELPAHIRLIRLPSLNLYDHPGHHILALRPRHLRSLADLSEWWAMATGRFGEPYSFGRRVYRYMLAHGRHYDVIHDNQSLSYGLLKLQEQGFPVVATIHHPITRDRAFALQSAKNALHQAGARRWYSFVDMQQQVVKKLRHLITVSEFAKHDIAHEFGCPLERITVIKNGVDVTLFKPLELQRIPGRLITTASSDQPLKGFTVLLEALVVVRQQLPHIQLVVIGKLNPRGANFKALQALGLADAVSFQQGLSAAALNREYNLAEVAVCPSLYEGFGLPAAEAMAAGTPVVSSNGGALAEVVAEAGLLVAAGDSRALASALVRVLTEPELQARLRDLGHQRILTHFCWRHAAERLTTYYQQQQLEPADADG